MKPMQIVWTAVIALVAVKGFDFIRDTTGI